MSRTDIDFNFVAHPLTGDITLKRDRHAIDQSVKNLILTNFYERGLNYELGSNVTDSLFENFTLLTVQTLKENIKRVINNFEPDVEIDEIDIRETNSNEISVTIYYYFLLNPVRYDTSILLTRLR